MNFTEIITPGSIVIKIMFDNWKFLAFDKKGKSIYTDNEGKGILHNVPLIVFVGTSFNLIRNYEKDYYMLKIQQGKIIVPYIDLTDGIKKYFFIETDKQLDMMPMRMKHVRDVSQMVKEIDAKIDVEYVIVDDAITSNDVIIIKNRYKVENLIYIELVNNYFLNEKLQIPDIERQSNINMLSDNPVFLATIHLKSMDLSKINQLLLDFEISVLDTEYILQFLKTTIAQEMENEKIKKNMPMLKDLLHSFQFYLSLLKRDNKTIKTMINNLDNIRKLTPFRTLISKVKSMYPGKEEQLLYTEYENLLLNKKESLQSKKKTKKV